MSKQRGEEEGGDGGVTERGDVIGMSTTPPLHSSLPLLKEKNSIH